MTKPKYFYVTDVYCDFDEQKGSMFINGDKEGALLEDGIFYCYNTIHCSENQRVIQVFHLPDWYEDDVESIDCFMETLHDHIMHNYGVFSETYDFKTLTEEELKELYQDPNSYRTVGLTSDRNRNDLMNDIYHVADRFSFRGFTNHAKSMTKDDIRSMEIVLDRIEKLAKDCRGTYTRLKRNDFKHHTQDWSFQDSIEEFSEPTTYTTS